MVMLSAGHVSDTCGSRSVSSAADVLWMSVVRGREEFVDYVRCVCVWLGAVLGGEWMSG